MDGFDPRPRARFPVALPQLSLSAVSNEFLAGISAPHGKPEVVPRER
jgi:hypothetical protein